MKDLNMKHLLLSVTVFVASASISVAQNVEQLFFDTDGGICNFQGDVSVFGQEGLFIYPNKKNINALA